MFGFFNRSNEARFITQVINVSAASLAAYHLFSKPEAIAGELVLDISVHLISAWSLQNHRFCLADIGAASLNLLRLGALAQTASTGCSSIPFSANLLDSIVHSGNILVSILTTDTDDEDTQATAVQAVPH
ncbi:MAG: hypothetical protein JJT82_01455 [Legionellaceae bacterium]|nr:hypothetical protein [Legionellaceae bacterium]